MRKKPKWEKNSSHTFICFILLLCFLPLAPEPLAAQQTVYVHTSPVTFSWNPAPGSIHHYNVYISRDGKPFQLIRKVTQSSCRVYLQDGVGQVLQLDAEDAEGNRGPMSDPSDTVIYFKNGSADDTDGDSMPDAWEVQYGLNPFQPDAQEDQDGDGVSNLDEYLAGTDPTQPPDNIPPDRPTLSFPNNGTGNVSLTPECKTGIYSDPDGDAHAGTDWEIRDGNGFLVLGITNDYYLTSLTVPDLVLDEATTYSWKVRFKDSRNGVSAWSEEHTFTTLQTSGDQNGNGIPDAQEVADDSVDLDGDGTPDLLQQDIRCVNTVVGESRMGIKPATGVPSIESVKSIDPATITDTLNRPEEIPLGLLGFKLLVLTPGDSAEVLVYFPEAVPGDAKWYKHDSINGWRDYSDYVSFNEDGKSLSLSLQDGGYGDADGTVNGVIVDPGGLSFTPSADTPEEHTPTVEGGDGGGGCFISTSAQGLTP